MCEALSTDISLKDVFGWDESPFCLEKITSYAGLVEFELKSIFNLNTHFEINERSWVRFLALSFLFLAILQKDVSFANSFALLFKPSGTSLTYIRKRSGPNMDPWGTSARIGLHDELCQFKTILWNLLEK